MENQNPQTNAQQNIMDLNKENNKIHTPMSITILNIIFGLGILVLLIISILTIMFSDDPRSNSWTVVVASTGIYYPLVAILSIIMSRRNNSYLWAFLPLIFIFVYPNIAAMSPNFFARPIDWMFKLIFGTKLF